MGLEKIIPRVFGKLGIAQTTADLLQVAKQYLKDHSLEGYSIIGKEQEKLVRQEISPDSIKRGIKYLEGVLSWLEDNCEIIPCRASPFKDREEKQRLEDRMGKSFVDTILIASEEGHTLYSDDLNLRVVAKERFEVEGVWSQAVLIHCLKSDNIGKDKCNEAVVKLANLHYYHTGIDSGVLIEAARQSDWSTNSQPLISVFRLLGGDYCDENSALSVGVQYLYELWKQPILVHQRSDLILDLIGAVTTGRDRRKVLSRITNYVRAQFVLLPLAEREVISLIGIWKQLHII